VYRGVRGTRWEIARDAVLDNICAGQPAPGTQGRARVGGPGGGDRPS
jgi:hypothetical protein